MDDWYSILNQGSAVPWVGYLFRYMVGGGQDCGSWDVHSCLPVGPSFLSKLVKPTGAGLSSDGTATNKMDCTQFQHF